MLSEERLREIEARAEAATECDRWLFEDGELLIEAYGGGARWTLQCYSKAPMPDMVAQFRNPADGVFAAHAREDIPALLAEVERLHWLVTTARELVTVSQNLKKFETFDPTERRRVLSCPWCGSLRLNKGEGHEEGCEWAEFAGAVRMLDESGTEKARTP